MKVWISDARSASGEAILRALRAEGVECLSPELPAIASDADVIRAAREHGAPDALIVTPRAVRPLTLENATEEQVYNSFYENLQNAFLLTRYVGGEMAKAGKGRILYVGSIHAEKPTGASFTFSAAMGAMKMLSMEAALQLGRSGLTCTYLEVGPVEGDEPLMDSEISPIYDNAAPQMAHKKCPTWDDIAQYALYFLKEPGHLLNGSSVRLEDGFTLNYRPREGGDPDWTCSLPEDAS